MKLLILEESRPDLIICDVTNRAEEWFVLLECARERYASLEIILLGEGLEYKYFRKTLYLGVIDYVEKQSMETELFSALQL